LKAVSAKNSRQSEAVKAAWAERKGYVAALEERCRNLELELERQQRLHGPLLESERIYARALAAVENRCQALAVALQEEKERCHAFQEAYQGQINQLENQREVWDSQQQTIKQRTRVAQQYFDVARNLGLKPGGDQAEPWLLQREET